MKLKDARKNAVNITELDLMVETPFSDSDIQLFKHIKKLAINYYHPIQNKGEEIKLERIAHFKNLESLTIHDCTINKWVIEPFLLPNLKHVELSYNKPTKYLLFQKLLRKVVKEQYPFEIRRILFYLVSDDQQQLKGYNTIQLLEAMVCDVPEIQTAIEKEIENRKENPLKNNLLTKKSSVYITGKINSPVEQIKKRLKEQGITIASKLDKDTTHIIVGVKPKINLEEFAKNNTTILIEKQLTNFLNKIDPTHLMEDSTQPSMIQNVIELLMSKDEANQLTGLEILKTGGVTDEIITHVVVIKFLSKSTSKVNKLAKTIINQYGSPALKTAITKNIRFEGTDDDIGVSEVKVYTHTTEVFGDTEIDALVFSYHLFRKIGKGRKYLLDNGTAEIRREVIEKSINKDGTILDLSDVQTVKFPEEIFEYGNILEIDLFQHKLKKIPVGFGQMKKLVKLNLFGTPLESLPNDFFTLSSLKKLFILVDGDAFITKNFAKLQLEELYIFFMKGMTHIPQTIFQISMMKRLIIAPGSITPGKHLINQIPEEIARLKNLEVLYVDSSNLKELPKSIGLLPNLQVYFEGKWSKIPRKVLQDCLPPRCQISPSPTNDDMFQIGIREDEEVIEYFCSKKPSGKISEALDAFLYEDQQRIDGCSIEQIVGVLNTNIGLLQLSAKKEIEKRSELPLKNNPPAAKSRTALLGNMYTGYDALSERLKNLGIETSKKITDETNYVVLGNEPGEIPKKSKFIYITENQLLKFLNNQSK